MTRLDVFITAATFGGWVIAAALLFTAGWAAFHTGRWTARLVRAGWRWLRDTRPPLPQRTPADVYRDVDDYRARRAEEQAADDLDNCRVIWPDAPSWRTAKAQHRHDTAKQRKEEDR